MHAIHKAQLGDGERVLDAGADPNRRGGNGETPLMMAAGYGYTDIVQMLLRRGANPALKDIDGATALDYGDGRRDRHRPLHTLPLPGRHRARAATPPPPGRNAGDGAEAARKRWRLEAELSPQP